MISPHSNAFGMPDETFATTNFTMYPNMKGQNGHPQSLGWLVGWLTSLYSLIFTMPACARRKWL